MHMEQVVARKKLIRSDGLLFFPLLGFAALGAMDMGCLERVLRFQTVINNLTSPTAI